MDCFSGKLELMITNELYLFHDYIIKIKIKFYINFILIFTNLKEFKL